MSQANSDKHGRVAPLISLQLRDIGTGQTDAGTEGALTQPWACAEALDQGTR